ncbi:unnamed protein product [Oikopleura dioica]|uniref:Transmembrane 9 superfamily member n=1 Tax=Oikopleura dioica TaxID=34765 RepID=E4YN05_OIKDI|nr:unnamed protein product [Oikopleura dioica]
MAYSLYDIRFKKNEAKKTLCQVTLETEDIEKLKQAIRELYYFEFNIDNLPVRGFIGHFEESGLIPVPHVERCYLWSSLHFTFMYNSQSNMIVSVNVSTAGTHPISLDDHDAPLNVEFYYSTEWIETSETISSRDKQKGSFFPKTLEIHWLSVINSVVLVVLLTGFIVIILMRLLNTDFSRYNKEDSLDDELAIEDECGWKVIHTEVFRFPRYISLLSAILGVGTQFLAMACGILIIALCGGFKPGHGGAIHTYSIILYCITSSIAGYVSGSFYRKFGGHNWVRNIIMTAFLFTGPFFTIWFTINCTHWYAGSTQALPFTTILLLMLVYILVGFPLTVLGGIIARNTTSDFDSPCRTRPIPRMIPPQPWYTNFICHCFFGGFLPFSAISVEIYYIFATVWGREQYTLYGVLLLVFFIVLSVSACISIALTYFQLSSEDYRWWWRSIFSAGSTGIFVFFYSCFYYLRRSNMSGAVETVEFLGYTALMCYIFFLTLGTIGFGASLKFIRYIYVNLKMD